MTAGHPESNIPRASRGTANRTVLLVAAVVCLTLAVGLIIYTRVAERPPASARIAPATVQHNRVARDGPSASTGGQQDRGDKDLWHSLGDALKVERIHPSGDEKLEERSRVRKQFTQIKRLAADLKKQGLQGEELYLALEDRLKEGGDPEALKLLDGYRKLEQSTSGTGLETMSPEEQFEALHRARVDAFGPEVADMLFFQTETLEKYRLAEKKVREDTGLSEEQKEDEIRARRNALQVELAERGAYVSFADERKGELEDKLRERYGETLDSMTPEERDAAMREMYRQELPPEVLEKVDKVIAAQAAKKAEVEARRQEREAILNDPGLSFEERQKALEQFGGKAPGPDGQEP